MLEERTKPPHLESRQNSSLEADSAEVGVNSRTGPVPSFWEGSFYKARLIRREQIGESFLWKKQPINSTLSHHNKMADPLSIAAGIAGLVKATSWIAENLYKISKSAKRAPQECTDVRTEVEEIRNILDQLKRFLLGTKRASASRTSLILVDQVIATLAATVTTISELEVFVDALASDEDMGLMDRFRWLSKEEDLKELLHKIHLHKGSLNLMLTILTW